MSMYSGIEQHSTLTPSLTSLHQPVPLEFPMCISIQVYDHLLEIRSVKVYVENSNETFLLHLSLSLPTTSSPD